MFECTELETHYHYTKHECMCELAGILSTMDDIEVVDIEKTFKEDTSISDYKPRLKLIASVLYKV